MTLPFGSQLKFFNRSFGSDSAGNKSRRIAGASAARDRGCSCVDIDSLDMADSLDAALFVGDVGIFANAILDRPGGFC